MYQCQTVLVDRRNIAELKSYIIDKVSNANLIGIDTETQDENAHAGIKEFRKGQRNAFDWNKMVVTGLSLYWPEEEGEVATAYYFNLNHADVENRLDWQDVKDILDAKKFEASWISHNAPFELTVLHNYYGYLLVNVICTLQMAVSAYGPDQYDRDKFIANQFGEMKTLFNEIESAFSEFDTSKGRNGFNVVQAELFSKIMGKSSDAAFSYNGVVNEVRYGYGLKEAVYSFFDVEMTTYEEVLSRHDAEHMGQLTGEQVAAYGAEDAFWAVKLFFKLYEFMTENCPETITPFFEQENPMIYVFAEIRETGIRINLPAVEARRDVERHNFAEAIRALRLSARKLLPFPEELNERLAKYDSWYGPNPKKPNDPPKGPQHRARLEQWINGENVEDDFEQCMQVSSSVSSAWAGRKVNEINLTYYYQSRLFMYDLCRVEKPIVYKGKIQSDAETRGTMKERFQFALRDATDEDEKIRLQNCIDLMNKLGEIAAIEQRMKLYLNTYMLLTDPDTQRMYPEVSSMLATRRMAASNPNTMQLAKRGESTYVRGFYLPDYDNHVFIAPDWSQIELVLVGEFSGDPEFKVAFGQTPYQDLHLGAAADVLSVMIPEVTYDMLKSMHKMEVQDLPPALLVKPNGEALSPKDAKKFWRTEVGKGSNFNYWFSGALSTVGDKLGWSPEQMWAATEAYRERFKVAEEWRVGLIEQAKWDGYVMLPDGHRRTRWEVTHEWATIASRMFENFNLPGVNKFGEQMIKATRTRAANQLVNAKIQGSCATLAKRSILSIKERIKADGFEAFFKMPIHDELVYSVHKDQAVDFIKMIRHEMANHPSIVSNLKIDCSVAIGRTFEPFNDKKFPHCLIEIDEAPELDFIPETMWGGKLDDAAIQTCVERMFA